MRKIKIVLGLVLLLAMLWFGFWQNSQPGNSISQVQNVKPAKVETKQSTNQIPQAAITTWIYIQQHHQAPENYVGGREFKNRERKLPLRNEEGAKPFYREWDIYPKREGVNRGAERLVSRDFEQAWYTPDHYKTFIEIKE